MSAVANERKDSINYQREAFCLGEDDSPLERFETFIQNQDTTPMSKEDIESDEITGNLTESVTENLTLRISDESRVTSALVDASKKRKTGSVFSVEVDLSSGEMGLGVKILKNNILVVSMLKRHRRLLGPGETAGLRLGDIIFGANFRPCIEGVKTLLHVVKQTLRLTSSSKSGSAGSRHLDHNAEEGQSCKEVAAGNADPILRPVITLQCWRCHQLCSDLIPGRLFPRADDVFVQGYSMFRNRVLSEWERWNFNEILLTFLKKELKIRLEDQVKMVASLGSNPRIRVLHNEVIDLERNILRAKGLRTALCVRIVSSKFIDDAVLYVLRIEDEESGLQWNIRKRYNDFYTLHKELQALSKYLQDIPFPKKKIITSRLSLRVIEERIVALEHFIRQAVHRLTQHSTTDAQASQSLRKVQEFLDVEMFINCLKPPSVDDQRFLELMTYRRLNDFASVSCQQCIRFVDSVDLDALAQNDKTNGYLPMLELVAQALREVEQYALQTYGQQMNQILRDRRPHMPNDKVKSFVAKCIRRQVEGAIYLPLRRAIFRIVYSFIADKAERLQKAMKILKKAPMKVFFGKGNYDELHLVKSLPLAVNAFRNLVNAYLPTDQGNMLMKAAGAVMEVISEMETVKNGGSVHVHCPPIDDLSTLPSPHPHSDAQAAGYAGTSLTKGLDMKTTSKLFASTSNVTSELRRNLSFSGGRKSRTDSSIDGSSASVVNPYSNDMLNKSVLADPAGTIFSAAEHVLVSKRDFDHDGAKGGGDTPPLDEDSVMSHTKLDDSSPSRDSMRELYSILQAERALEKKAGEKTTGTSTANDAKETNDASGDTNILSSLVNHSPAMSVERSGSQESHSSSGDSGVSGSDGGSGPEEPVVMQRKPPICPSSPTFSEDMDFVSTREGRVDSDDIPEEDPGLSISASIAQTLLATSSSSAIRGSSVSRLEGSGLNQLFKAAGERRDTYKSPFKNKALVPNEVPPSIVPRTPDGGSTTTTEGMTDHSMGKPKAVGADDFLPMFTYVLVQSELPQLLLVKELMVTLVDNEEMYGECGYYMATLEAATQHIVQMGDDYSVTLSQSKAVDKLLEKSGVALASTTSLRVPSQYGVS